MVSPIYQPHINVVLVSVVFVCQEFFEYFDTDGSGLMDLDEFCVMIVRPSCRAKTSTPGKEMLIDIIGNVTMSTPYLCQPWWVHCGGPPPVPIVQKATEMASPPNKQPFGFINQGLTL